MKENKDYQIKCRLTQTEKERIFDYCERHDMTLSEFIRMACDRIFGIQEDDLK